jgi:uncharacterized membrane protein
MKQMSDPTVQMAKWLGGAAAGALLMYMLDPERGADRRAQSGEKLRGLTRQTGSAIGEAWRGMGSRVGSTVETLGSKMGSKAEDISGKVQELGSKAGSTVESIGQKLGSPAEAALRAESAPRPDGAAGQALGQGAGQVLESAKQLAGGDWAPTARSAAVLGGGALGLYGLLRRSPIGITLGLAGLALLARGASNLPLQRMMKSRPLSRTIDVEKSIRIDASPEQVYDLWTNYENFPQFMAHVVEVRDLGGRRSHWVVKGPAGTEFEWDAVLTEQSRPRRLAWRSEPGADISQAGSVQFEPERGGTRVTVRMSYSPPAGVVGHGIASLFGADPKRQMDKDLACMKAFIERGAMPHGTAQAASSSSSKFLH